MFKEERENEILSFLSKYKYVTVEFLTEKIHMSASSIRRDLTCLEEKGLVQRCYGGVRLLDAGKKIAPFDLRYHENAKQKRMIANKAVSLVGNYDVIFLDGSTTCFYMSEGLRDKRGVTVVTNSVPLVSELSKYILNVYCTGGITSRENNSVLCGSCAENTVSGIHANKMFFSAEAVSYTGDVAVLYEAECALRKKMIENSDEKILLCDSSKIGGNATFRICGLEDTDIMISDSFPDGFSENKAWKTELIKADNIKQEKE